ncbi:prepilin peptidase [Nocardioides pantholopis]|uniref:prepilin peptidase n=1 Tax=Nocardioides pantholopis TaxID=2483798 RepID=UPI000F08C692|nr:A24 family peptidase [Nocardioides pantholopis]
MSPAAVIAAVVCAQLCCAAGLLLPALVARIPEPGDAGPDKEPYAVVAAGPLRRWGPDWCAGAGAVVGFSIGWDPVLVGLVPLVPIGVALAVVDWRTRLLPRALVLPATAVALALAVLDAVLTGNPDDLVRGLAGLVLARTSFWLLWWVHSAGLGFGDVRLAALLGLVLGYLGWAELLVGLYAGFVLLGVPGLVLAVVRRDRGLLRTAYPFGPFLLLGALVGIAVGPALAGLATG